MRMAYARTQGILIFALIVFAANCTSSSSEDPAEQLDVPNIVFIMADDLGYGHLGSYGQEKIRTPRLDQMAEEGIRFTQAYAGHCVCAPSRSVLMTGQHLGHTSVRINGGGSALLPQDVTVAEMLKKTGYTTGIFGKWGLGDAESTGIPNKQGFDQFFGYLHQVHAHFYYPYFLWKNQEKVFYPENDGEQRQTYSHDVIMEEALTFIRENKDRRFFLYLPLTIPHFELLVPEDSFEQYEGEFQEPWQYEAEHYASQAAPRTTLAAMITRMDRDIGRLLDLLKETKLEENTIVFFTSDNGGYRLGGAVDFFNANGPLRGYKGDFYEGGIRVPMIVRWPGKVPAHQTDDLIWAFWDVMPTLAEFARTEPPEDIDGISFAKRILGEEQEEPSRFLYWEKNPGMEGGTPPWSQAVRWGKWKAIRQKPDLPLELYNLAIDIGEENDVAGDHPEVVAEIEAYLKTARTVPRKYPPQEPSWSYPRVETGYVR